MHHLHLTQHDTSVGRASANCESDRDHQGLQYIFTQRQSLHCFASVGTRFTSQIACSTTNIGHLQLSSLRGLQGSLDSTQDEVEHDGDIGVTHKLQEVWIAVLWGSAGPIDFASTLSYPLNWVVNHSNCNPHSFHETSMMFRQLALDHDERVQS